MPYQPCFDAAGVAGGDNGQINFTTAYINVGGHYSTSTYRFTAPVAGNYLFYTNFIKNNQPTTTNRRRFLKNGSAFNGGRHIRLGGEGDNSYDWGSISQIITLAANDYVTVDHYGGNTYGNNEYDSFGGYLIG
ncbi:complement C1q domain-containing protein [Gammaproteobacteria bacterium]|nr:complement C1q domain-containing protein [Gammaproteobacteria bacterium]